MRRRAPKKERSRNKAWLVQMECVDKNSNSACKQQPQLPSMPSWRRQPRPRPWPTPPPRPRRRPRPPPWTWPPRPRPRPCPRHWPRLGPQPPEQAAAASGTTSAAETATAATTATMTARRTPAATAANTRPPVRPPAAPRSAPPPFPAPAPRGRRRRRPPPRLASDPDALSRPPLQQHEGLPIQPAVAAILHPAPPPDRQTAARGHDAPTTRPSRAAIAINDDTSSSKQQQQEQQRVLVRGSSWPTASAGPRGAAAAVEASPSGFSPTRPPSLSPCRGREEEDAGGWSGSFPQPSSLQKPPRRTSWGGRRVICLVDVQVPWSRPRRRDRDKSASFFRAAAEQILRPSSLFLFLLLRFYTGHARGQASSVPSDRLTPPTLPAWRPGPSDRETPPSHAYASSPSPRIPSVCVPPRRLPSFSPFSQTTTCKKGVSPGLALHCARHTAGPPPV